MQYKNSEEARAKNRQYRATYRAKYPDRIKESIKRTYDKHKESNTDYYQKRLEANRIRMAQYIIDNPEKFKATKARCRKAREKDPLFRFRQNTHTRVRNSIASLCVKKSKCTAILGCSLDEFREYIQSKWQPWMNWSNYGNWDGYPTQINHSWDLDHIIPVSTATTEEEIVGLNHHTNFQPLCSYTNRCIKKNQSFLSVV